MKEHMVITSGKFRPKIRFLLGKHVKENMWGVKENMWGI
jgi:hypothetical protein